MQKIHVGECIKIAQKKTDITTLKMAKDFSVFRQQIQRWRASEDMRVGKVLEMAEYFEMDICKFLNLETEK